ncbi:MAG: hypothetical protein H7Z41_00340 [Cytophagales bacterium]|nr:hypothetical protein [Armatimonadota bacterium]
MAKLFSTRTHGILDYATAALLPVVPRALGWDRDTTRVFDTAAGAAAINGLVTRYELGVLPLMPMQGHLAADAAWGTSLLAAAPGVTARNPAAGWLLAGFGLFGWIAALTTQTRSPQELAELGPQQALPEPSLL